MAKKLMYISNDDTQYYPFCRLQLVVELKCLFIQLNETTNLKSIKSPKLSQRISKHYYKTLGTKGINSSLLNIH